MGIIDDRDRSGMRWAQIFFILTDISRKHAGCWGVYVWIELPSTGGKRFSVEILP